MVISSRGSGRCRVRSWSRMRPGRRGSVWLGGWSGGGIECRVAAPSRLQRPCGDRVKTDVRDARHLARLLHLGEIVAVAVPSVEQEAARDLVRAREDVRGDLMSARHRLSKLLLRQGIVYYGGRPWTGAHDLWLRAQRRSAVFTLPGLGLAFDIAYDTLLATVARRDRLDAAITEMAAASEFTPVVTRLGCLRGVSTLTAFGLAVEIGDWHRLDWPLDRRLSRVGAHRVLLRRLPVARVDHQDRERPRPPAADRSGLASPQALPHRCGPAPPTGPGRPRRARSRAAGEPAPARPVECRSTPATSGPWSPTPRSPASSPAGAGRWPSSTDRSDPPLPLLR